MAKRSPTRVNQTYETGCTWRMLRIFNFREGRSDRRLVSSRRHLNAHANGKIFLRLALKRVKENEDFCANMCLHFPFLT